jgi:hypothetical protein
MLDDETEEVEAEVFLILQDFKYARAGTADGEQYVFTAHTAGIDFVTLRVGQRFRCTITKDLRRVVRAHLLP